MDTKPNMLIIMTDQQRFDSLGCYGFEAIPTPHLDRLAAEGLLFENCYVNNPICTPSRASIFTGKPISGHGVHRLNSVLPENEVFFTRRLQEKGYQTALFGKLHVSGARHEKEQRHPNDGFDIYEWCHEPALFIDAPMNAYGRWLREHHPDFYQQLKINGRKLRDIPQEVHFTHWVVDKTVEFLTTRESSQPFCCIASIFDPHNPYTDYPAEMLDRLDQAKLPPPLVRSGEARKMPEGARREHEHGYMGGYHEFSAAEIHEMRVGYYASVALIDQEVGRVLAALEASGQAANTLVIFVSDHGDMLGDHELLAKGAFFYDGCTRVPLIMRYPGCTDSGRRIATLVQPHDIAATILACAGYTSAELAASMPDAINLMALAEQDPVAPPPRDYAVCEYKGTGICDRLVYFDPPIYAAMFRDSRYKLNVYYDLSPVGDTLQGQLFDMVADPQETIDLWTRPEFAEVKLQLLMRFMNWTARCDAHYHVARVADCGAVSTGLAHKLNDPMPESLSR